VNQLAESKIEKNTTQSNESVEQITGNVIEKIIEAGTGDTTNKPT
jgi:hypothetical protein